MIVFIISIILRIDYEIYFQDFYADKAYQVFAAENYNNGLGLSIIMPELSDLSKTTLGKLEGYPPAYSYLISFFSPILTTINTTLIIDSFAIILLLLALLIILKLFKINNTYQVLLLLFFGLTPSPFGYLNSTDLLVTSLTILNFALFLFFYNKNIRWIIFFSFFTFLPPIFKYSALPLIVLFPSLFIILSFINKENNFLKKGIFNLFLTISLFLIYNNFFPAYPKSKVFENGFYIFQLLQIDDYLFKSFFYIEFYVKHLIKNKFYLGISKFITVLFSFFVLFLCTKKSFSLLKLRKYSQKSILIYSVVIINFLLLASLSYLSLRVKGETWQTPPWTYVEETRYYGPAIILIQITFFIILYKTQKFTLLKYKLFGIFMLFSYVFNCAYGIKQLFNIHIKKNYDYTFYYNNSKFIEISNNINSNYPYSSDNIVFSSNNGFENIFVATHSTVDKFIDLQNILDNEINCSSTLNFIVHCSKKELNILQANNHIIPHKTYNLKNNSLLCFFKIKKTL